MVQSEVCERDHPLAETGVSWRDMLDSQRGDWRHKCAACAYELGYQHALRDAAVRIADLFEEETQRRRLV